VVPRSPTRRCRWGARLSAWYRHHLAELGAHEWRSAFWSGCRCRPSLDRGRLCGRHWRLMLWAVALGIEYICRRAVLDPELRRVFGGGLGREGVTWRSAAPDCIIIALANPSSSTRCDFCRPALDDRNDRCLRVGLPQCARDVVDLFPQGAAAGSELISRSSEPGRLAELATTLSAYAIVAASFSRGCR